MRRNTPWSASAARISAGAPASVSRFPPLPVTVKPVKGPLADTLPAALSSSVTSNPSGIRTVNDTETVPPSPDSHWAGMRKACACAPCPRSDRSTVCGTARVPEKSPDSAPSTSKGKACETLRAAPSVRRRRSWASADPPGDSPFRPTAWVAR